MGRDRVLPKSKREKVREKQQKEAARPLAVGRILIVCEGTKTEPNYFEAWKEQVDEIKKKYALRTTASICIGDEISIDGEGKNTLSLVEVALEKKNKSPLDYNQVWCVFDRDSFPPSDFDNAIKKAESCGMKVAYSNEAFELWYLLHFVHRVTSMSRSEFKDELSKHLGMLYQKNDPTMYGRLLKYKKDAIRNAKTLRDCVSCSDKCYSKHNPSTTVDQLVEALDEYVKDLKAYCFPNTDSVEHSLIHSMSSLTPGLTTH